MSSRKLIETITLECPVEHGSEVIETLSVYRPKGKNMKNFFNTARQGEGDAMVRLMSDCCDQPTSVIDELDAEDWSRVSDFLLPLLGKQQKDGTKD